MPLTESDLVVLMRELQPVVREAIQGAVAPLRDRVEAIEKKPAVEYKGVWEDAFEYPAGALVTRSGSLWLALRSTHSQPGEPQSGWKLVVKQGQA